MKKEKTKVLVVDDIHANLIAMEQVLCELDIAVVTAHSGKEAISYLLRDTAYALILMDVQMPEMDGFETAELIRQDPDSSLIPVIFVTAISKEDQYIFRGYEAGAVDYIFKPVDENILLSKVKTFVDLYEQKKQLQQALKEAERAEYTKHLLLDNVGDGIAGLDAKFNISYINQSASRLLNVEPNKALGKNITEYLFPELSEMEFQETEFYQSFKNLGKFHTDDSTVYTGNRCSFRSEYNLVAIKDNGHTNGSVLLFRDVTERVAAQEKLLHIAQYDQLTGLANRMLFWNFLSKTLANAKRHSESFALLYIDLDEFKSINDSMGHLAGDLLLKKVSERLLETVRETDLVARLGGDEFAVVATRVSSPEVVADLASRIIAVLMKSFPLVNETVQISASIGISVFPGHGDEAKELTRNADTAMYEAKAKGKNNYQFFSAEMQQSAESYLALAKGIERAINHQQLSFATDSWHKAQSDERLAYRAKLIWNEPNYRDMDYHKLLDVLAAAKCSALIEDRIIQEANEFLGQHTADNIVLDFYLNPHQVSHRHLSKRILPKLQALNCDLNQIHLMINFSLLQDQSKILLEEVGELKSHGISFSLYNVGFNHIDVYSLCQFAPICIQLCNSMTVENLQHPSNQKPAILLATLLKKSGIKVLVNQALLEHLRGLLPELTVDDFIIQS